MDDKVCYDSLTEFAQTLKKKNEQVVRIVYGILDGNLRIATPDRALRDLIQLNPTVITVQFQKGRRLKGGSPLLLHVY